MKWIQKQYNNICDQSKSFNILTCLSETKLIKKKVKKEEKYPKSQPFIISLKINSLVYVGMCVCKLKKITN